MNMREKRGHAIVDRNFGGGIQIEVELKRLSEVLEEIEGLQRVGKKVDLFKVDVEGLSLEALRGKLCAFEEGG